MKFCSYVISIIKPMKKAFTLAEVLVTLSIIGIVAAMTIPNLQSAVDEYIFRGAMLKNYAMLKNTHALSRQNDEDFYEEPTNSVMSQYIWDNPDILKNYFKIKKGPFKGTNGAGYNSTLYNPFYKESKSTLKWLNGKESDYWLNSSALSFQLEDGTIISFHITNCHSVSIFMDVNGPKKPNTFGKDIFLFNYTVDAHANMGSPVSNNPAMYHQIMPQGTLGTQSCGGNLYWTEPATDCTKKGNGTTCARDIIRNRSFKIK